MASPPAGSAVAGDLSLTRREAVGMGTLYAVVVAVTAAGFLAAFEIGIRWPVLAGLGLVAYILGLRHGFDADHIAAIDNTTRKLLQEGKRPLTVGTWFSLGHSTIVVGLVVGLIGATEFVSSRLPALQQVGGILGASISGIFLILIGLVNLAIVGSVYQLFRRARRGQLDDAAYEDQMRRSGFLYRYFYRLFRTVDRPRDIYPIGLLFGLGFDTATEVALIAITVGVGTTSSAPLWTVLVLPLLFTCGMVLSDTTDGFAMRYAYAWAFNKPVRKIYYNLTLTVISVLVAFFVAGVELLQVVGTETHQGGWIWTGVASLDFETLGIGIVALFLVAWGIATAIYRWRGYDDRPELEPLAPASVATPGGREPTEAGPL